MYTKNSELKAITTCHFANSSIGRTRTIMMSTSSSSSSSLPLALLQKSSLSCYHYKPTAVVFPGRQDRTQVIQKMLKFGEVLQLNKKKKMHKLHASSSSSVKNLVFEDSDQGIICYKDEAGDIICEGYDEGPRLEQSQTKSTSYNSRRDVEIIEILQQSNRSSWNQTISNGGSDSKYAYKGPKGVSFNGF